MCNKKLKYSYKILVNWKGKRNFISVLHMLPLIYIQIQSNLCVGDRVSVFKEQHMSQVEQWALRLNNGLRQIESMCSDPLCSLNSWIICGSKALFEISCRAKPEPPPHILVACTRLYTPLCPSVYWLVGWSVCWSVILLLSLSILFL